MGVDVFVAGQGVFPCMLDWLVMEVGSCNVVWLVVEVDFVLEMTGCRGIDRGLPVFHAFGQVWIMDRCSRGSLKYLKMDDQNLENILESDDGRLKIANTN